MKRNALSRSIFAYVEGQTFRRNINLTGGTVFGESIAATLVNDASVCLGLAGRRFPRERASERKFAGTRDSRAYDHRPRDRRRPPAFILVANP